MVDFRRVIERLRDLNYKGAMTIEREIRGAQQSKDILESKNYLEKNNRRSFSSLTRSKRDAGAPYCTFIVSAMVDRPY